MHQKKTRRLIAGSYSPQWHTVEHILGKYREDFEPTDYSYHLILSRENNCVREAWLLRSRIVMVVCRVFSIWYEEKPYLTNDTSRNGHCKVRSCFIALWEVVGCHMDGGAPLKILATKSRISWWELRLVQRWWVHATRGGARYGKKALSVHFSQCHR